MSFDKAVSFVVMAILAAMYALLITVIIDCWSERRIRKEMQEKYPVPLEHKQSTRNYGKDHHLT